MAPIPGAPVKGGAPSPPAGASGGEFLVESQQSVEVSRPQTNIYMVYIYIYILYYILYIIYYIYYILYIIYYILYIIYYISYIIYYILYMTP